MRFEVEVMIQNEVELICELSPMQQAMLFASLYAPGSGVYVVQLSLRLTGRLDVGAFERAWRRVVERHDALRTGFHWEDLERPVQVILREVDLRLRRESWRGSSGGEQEARLREFLDADRESGFELSEPPLMRLALFELTADTWHLVWSLHHLVVDGWSLGLLLKELFTCYAAFAAGREPALPAPRSYGEYLAWLQRQDAAAAEAFWRRSLAGLAAPTLIAGGDGRAAAGFRQSRRRSLRLDPEETAALRELARRHRLTLNTLLQGAWALVLAQATGGGEVVFGGTVAGRPGDLPGADSIVGLFINTLPVRVEVDPERPLLPWLHELQERQAEARRFEHAPLYEIQTWSGLPAGTALFDSILVFESYPLDSSLAGLVPELSVSWLTTNEQTNYPLNLVVVPGPELSLEVLYDSRRLDAPAAARLLERLAGVLRAFAADPDRRMGEVPLLLPAERHQVLVEWNDTAAAYPREAGLPELFAAVASAQPDAPAVVAEDGEVWSYRRLDEMSSRLARHLASLEVERGARVGVAMERSAELVVAFLGVLKAGAAYVPLDPGYPEDRLAFMREDSGVAVVLTPGWRPSPGEEGWRSGREAGGEDLAYILYTSGSTGRPKGVAVPHRAVVRLVRETNYLALAPGDRLAFNANPSFDAATFEIWATLLSGAALVVVPQEVLLSPPELDALLEREKVTVLHLTAALFAQVAREAPAALARPSCVLFGGEASAPAAVARALADGKPRRLLQMYGPTESTTFATFHSVTAVPAEAATVPIGRPLANTTAYVLDRWQQPVPLGSAGELWLGGEGLAWGYLNRPDLTAERFLPDPWSAAPGARLYRTGDLVRVRSDGALEFQGRLDHQVKIRGFRIEPGEVEAVLAGHPAVAECAVLARRGDAQAHGDVRLVAYVVLDRTDRTDPKWVLSSWLREKLPASMVPSAWVFLDALPLTPNGKVDRRALPPPELKGAAEDGFTAPGDPVEELLAGIWSAVLGREGVGVHDDFFALGGHSLLATQVASRIRGVLGVELPLRSVFEEPTVAGLARVVRELRAEGPQAPPLRRLPRDGAAGDLPLSFAQQRLWFIDQLEPGNPGYNIPTVVRLTGELSVPRLARAFAAVVHRHEVLRTTFASREGRAVQVIHPEMPAPLPVVDLAAFPAAAREALAQRLIREESLRPFDLELGPLLRLALLRMDAGEHLLLLIVHHIVSDGWSVGVLVREVQALYRGLPLPELPVQYADFAAWQRQWLAGEVLERQLAWWRERLAGTSGALELPTDHPRPAVLSLRGAEHRFTLDRELSRRLQELGRREGATPFMVLAAALFALLARLSGQRDLNLGAPIANRNRIEIEGLIGFFVNTLVLRADVGRAEVFLDLLVEVREASLGAYAHQDLPFEKLVDEVQPERDLSRSPLVQVALAVNNAPLPEASLEGLRIVPESPPAQVAKFDLAFIFAETAEGCFAGALQYATDLYDATTAVRLARQLAAFLGALTAGPEEPLADLSPLTAAERHQVLREWNDTASRTARPGLSMHQLFEEQVDARPEAPAAVWESTAWSYAELEARANRLANFLAGLVDRGTPVGVWMERSLPMLATVLGILKAGGTYVPLDAVWPAERVETILARTGAPAIVFDRTALPAVDAIRWHLPRLADVLCLDVETPEPEPEPLDAASIRSLFDFVAERATDRVTAGGFVSRATGLPFTAAEVDEYRDRVLSLASPWLRPGARVLEVGCGSGLILWEMARRVGRSVGLDPSQRTQERNREHARREGIGNVELPVGFAHEIAERFAPGSFDLIVLASTVQFFPGPRYLERVVADALRLLAPGGALLLADVMDARREPVADQLALDEDLFHDLGKAEIHHRTEGFANELGERYDVILRPGAVERRKRTWTSWHVARASSIRPPAVGSPEDVAYVIHTSGSTGAPKGIAVQHAPAVQLVDWVNRTFGVGPGDRLLFITSLCFDLSVYDIFGTLAAGGTVHIASEAALREPAELVRLLSEEPITIWDSAPAALQQLAPLFPAGERRALRLVLLSGDWIPVPLPDEVRAAFPGARVVSLGGATEATVWSNWYPIGAVDPRWPSIPYGRPIANARYHVLDAGLSPCPIGVPGDLSIGGSCLCVGYAGQPELTAAAFVPDPFAAEPGARLYRTGDRARFFRDGNLEFLGRADQQVKVRGYRIELGEIEAVLLRHAAVREAVAMAWEGSLVAYVVLDRTDPTDRFDPTDPKSALAAWLGARLPQYMLPSSFVLLDAMPVTANGKLDRKALPAPEWGGEEGSYEAPSDPVEETLVHLWTELLGRERVGVRESFFTLGGHSLLATQLMSRLRGALGVELALRELFEAPTIAELARTVRRARREEAAPAPPPLVPVPRDGAQEGLPLSFAQQRLWLIDQLEPGNPAYNVPLAVRLTGEVAPALVERIFAEVVRRHEALRTMFASREGQPVQVVAPPEPAPRLPLIDLSGLAREAEVRTLLREEARRPFDLQRGPLLRLRLVRLAPAEHLLMITLHHIVADAWSMGVLLREVAALYAAFSQGRPSPLPALPVQYADFAVWQRSWLQGAALEAQLAYWRRQLAGAPAVLELPLDRPRPAVQTFRGAARPIALPPALSEGVRELGRSEGATPFMVLLAAWAVLLGRHAGQEDVVLGTPIAGRNRRELEDLIGFFVNTLALRTDLAGEPAFSELLGRVRATVLDAFAHQDLPFERLVEELVPERDLSRSPLFQTLFALQNAPAGALAIPGLSLQPVAVDSGSAKLDLTLSLREGPAGFAGTLEHNADLFDGATAERLLARFAVLLEGAVAEPGRALHDLPLLPPAEREQVLREHNATRRDYPREAGLAELFAQMARRLPDAPAVIAAPAAGGEVWSYRRLDEASDGLAQRLRSLGVRSEAAVGISMERSPELILGTLAIVKAGGTYVPLDAGYPDERLAFMLADTGARIVLVDERARERMAALAQALVVVDSRASLSLPSSEPLPSFAPPPDSLAYVIYTSGSTGTPKGVAVPQRAIVRLVRETDYAQLGRGDRVAHLSNTSFDAATFEIWGALLNGAAVVVIPREVALAPAELAALLRRQGVTAIFLTTALFNQVAREAPDAFFTVRHVLFGGEAVDPGAAARVLERGGPERLLHVYGPTESTTFATWHLLRAVPPGAATLPIGLPVANTTACVLDPWQRPVPLGVTGELFLGGDGLARGYLNRPDLTAERFVPHPWPHPGRSGERLYRTGDLVRQRPEGSIEFLGRRDDQVKIRGFRIEPGEIEAVLGGHPAVRERVVVVREGVAGLRSLAAYVVLQPESRLERPGAALRAWLEERLPDYMIPAAFVLLDALPLTPNGKVDRGALPAPELSREEERPAAPADPVEELLAGIWAEVLGRERVGVHDDFFALGGYSLLATQVMSRVREVLGVELPLRRLFESSTVAELARDVREAREAREAGSPAPPITPVPRDRDLPLSFAQQRLWLIDQLDPGGSLYNLPLALRLTGEVAPALLERLFAEIVRRHEALRTTFDFRGGQPVQVIAPPEPAPQLPLIDLSGLRNRSDPADLEAREATALALARAEACRPFDLRRRPLLRLALLRLDASDHLLLLTLHHIVSDGWSMGVLVREIAALHAAFSRGLPSPLPALPVQYADFAVWQRSWLRGAVLDAQLDLWRRRLAGAPRLLELPTDRPRPAAQTFRGATRPIALSAALAEGVREVCRRESMTPFMVLLAAWALLLGRLAGQDEVVLGTPIAGRNRREIEDLIGFFINTLALRIELFPSRSQPKEPSFRELLGRVRETALEAFALQDVPFERLVEELVVERDLACSPLFQVLFALQNAPAAALTIPGLSLAPVAVDSGTAKFDLALSLTEVPAGFAGFLQHNTDLFEDATAERLLARFAALLEAAVADPGCTLPDLPLLLPPERHQMLREWNDIAEVDSPGVLLHDLLATQAAKTPDSVVAVLAGEALSYRELDRRAHRLARRLIDLGVAPDGPISLLADPDPQALIGMLGILKAGCGFVPIDPRHPDERLAWTLEDCDCAVLVTQRRHLKRAEALARAAGGLRHIVCLEDVLPSGPPRSGRGRDPGELRSLAYVVYTSGSTGRPKGVQVVHESLVPMLVWGCAYFGLGAHTRVLQSLSFCFDFGIFEQLTTVLAGGTLVFPGEAAGDPAAYAREIVRSGINTLHTTPAFARELAAAGLGLESLEILHLGGEALSWETVARLCEAAPRATVYNGYGPTEATINSSIFRLGRAQGGGGAVVPIGRRSADNALYVLDRAGRLSPLGARGELHVGGIGVARGYLNRPELTAERFVPHPWPQPGKSGERLYRTGDLARHRPDGSVELHGRLDDQVKIRGFRIEPGEIEAALASHPQVAECAVLARRDDPQAPGDVRLVAYVVLDPTDRTDPTDPQSALSSWLREKLPDYMVPSAFVSLEALPLTPNGKLDRKALPAPGGDARAYVAPSDPVEEKLAAVWAEVLRLDRVGINDDFFALGGHSLLATQVVSRVREELGVELPLRRLFTEPTIRQLARGLVPSLAAPARNVSLALRLSGELAVAALENAFMELVRRHPALRTTLALQAGRPVQGIAPPETVRLELPLLDLSDAPEEAREEWARELALEEARSPFDLQRGPLLRLGLLRLSEREHLLLVTLHPIVADGWSEDVLLREIGALSGFAGTVLPEPEATPEAPSATAREGISEGISDGILATIGRTPLIRLRRFLPTARFELFAKLEALNPGGSIKDRPALAILEDALDSGAIGPQTLVIESSSGNMGIGLAQACRYHGLRFLCVVDPKTERANLRILRAYGAEIELVEEPDPVSGEFLPARLDRVRQLIARNPNAFWPDQYANLKNPGSHYETTMREVATALGGRVDFLFVATSTCGTVRGCAEYLRDHGLSTRVVAVDAVGSLIFSDVRAKRLVPGLGAGLRPPLCDISLIDECVHVTDLDCVVGCRRLVAREAILAGGSSGGVLSAVEKLKDRIPEGAVCVAILPDRGERYLETVFSDEWVREHFGDAEHLWSEDSGALHAWRRRPTDPQR